MRIALVGSYDQSLVNFRGPLIRALAQRGHEVLAVAPAQTEGISRQVAALGARFVPVSLSRAGLNPWQDWRSGRSLQATFSRERPDIVLAYTIKPVSFGIPAAYKAGVAFRYALITGLGAAFNTRGLKGFMLKRVASLLYRRSLRLCTRVIVQNRDIAVFLRREHLAPPEVEVCVVPGSGVDTGHFCDSAPPAGAAVFVLLARMLRDKGVTEFVAAARLVKKQVPDARFLLVGDIDPNPAAISAEQLDRWNTEGVVEYRPAVADVRPLLAAATAYVLPSYHEGMPRSVLEAMAMGRPVITTDTIGCRETISNAGPADTEAIRTGENGFLVPVRTVEPLAAAMLRLAGNSSLSAQMGRRGREIATRDFDARRINDQMLGVMNLLPGTLPEPALSLRS